MQFFLTSYAHETDRNEPILTPAVGETIVTRFASAALPADHVIPTRTLATKCGTRAVERAELTAVARQGGLQEVCCEREGGGLAEAGRRGADLEAVLCTLGLEVTGEGNWLRLTQPRRKQVLAHKESVVLKKRKRKRKRKRKKKKKKKNNTNNNNNNNNNSNKNLAKTIQSVGKTVRCKS